MKKHTIIISFLIGLTSLQGQAQEINKMIQNGNDLYKQNQFDKAEAAYKEASDVDKTNTTAAFNRANALIRQNKTEDAFKLLDDVIMNTGEPGLKAKAYYNQGVMLSGQQKLEESIEAYKKSLRLNPDDKDARENLQKALIELKKKTPPPPPPKKENKKNQQQQQKQQQQPKMNEKEAEQRLDLLDQKEKELQQRMQKAKTGVAQPKDW